MHLLDWTAATPAENLACDEALLEICEESDHPGFLRFWESPIHFVVLGFSKRLAEEVNETECTRCGIQILRRCSGGGTVLQGPGCLNYSLVLPLSAAPELESITGANCYIMRKNRAAVARIASEEFLVQGHTDLTVNGLKFSGNAQRRKRRCLLFHGTFLLGFDLELINATVRLPLQQPEYRNQREHLQFVTNLSASREELKGSLANEWNAREVISTSEKTSIARKTAQLVQQKYSLDEWNRRA
jgi:lipoate---protein ligase